MQSLAGMLGWFSVSEGSSAAIPQLKFADEYVDPILRGKKTATIRYGLDEDFENFTTGKRIMLCDESGERFATAVISDRGYDTAEWIAHFGIEGHRDYDSTVAFLNKMREYYPDAELTPSTCFEIIYWEDYWE